MDLVKKENEGIVKSSLNKKSVLIIIFMLFIIISSVLTFSMAVFMAQIFLGMITLPIIMKNDYRTAKLYIIIFIISISFVFLVYAGNQTNFGTPYYIGGSDDLKFEQIGYRVANSNIYSPSKLLGTVVDRYDTTPFFYIYIALIIKFSNLFGGYSTFLPRIINVYFLIWICMIIYYLLKKYAKFTDIKAYISIGLFALTPNIQYINSHVFRDTFNLLQVFLIIYLFDNIINRKNIIFKIIDIVCLFILIYVTYYTRANSLALAGIIIILMIGDRFKIKKRHLIVLLFPLLIASDLLEVLRLRYFIETYSRYVSNIAGDGFG